MPRSGMRSNLHSKLGPLKKGTFQSFHGMTIGDLLCRRFPVVSGMKVSWDSRREPGQRVLGVWLTKEAEDSIHGDSGQSTPRIVEGEPIPRSDTSRKYNVVTREYMAEGHDGFEALKRGTYLVDDETGQPMSTLVRKYLLGGRQTYTSLFPDLIRQLSCIGSHFVKRMSRMVENSNTNHLRETTRNAIQRERARNERESRHGGSAAAKKWKHVANLALRWARSRTHYQEQFQVCTSEHMSDVDAYDGKSVRVGGVSSKDTDLSGNHDDLLVIEPEVDGRLKDAGRD